MVAQSVKTGIQRPELTWFMESLRATHEDLGENLNHWLTGKVRAEPWRSGWRSDVWNSHFLSYSLFVQFYNLYAVEGNDNPLQYSCLENPMDRGTWRATVHRVTKSWTWLKRLSTQHKICMIPGKELDHVTAFHINYETIYILHSHDKMWCHLRKCFGDVEGTLHPRGLRKGFAEKEAFKSNLKGWNCDR